MWPPWGPRKRAPKGLNHVNFKVTSSSDPEVEQSCYVDLLLIQIQAFLCEELKLFVAVPTVAPMGPGGGGGGGNGFGEGA